jgi:hypothetical protein
MFPFESVPVFMWGLVPPVQVTVVLVPPPLTITRSSSDNSKTRFCFSSSLIAVSISVGGLGAIIRVARLGQRFDFTVIYITILIQIAAGLAQFMHPGPPIFILRLPRYPRG